VEINVLTFIYAQSEGDGEFYFGNEFEKYATENNLNITVNAESITFANPSDSLSHFISIVETSLKKNNDKNFKNDNKNKKFDIYIYDNKYTNLYGPYLLNLKDYLPKEYIEMYDSKIVSELCSYQDKVVGLPWFLSYEILHSNIYLLNKYNKPLPKTWDELIDICKYIMKEENDPDLICYNGAFDDT